MVRISEKHGVNPSVIQCYFCGEAKGVAMLGRLPDDAEAPRQAVYDHEPCDRCKGWMEQGIIFISIRDGENGENPYRTGKYVVLQEESVKRMVNEPTLLADILKRRMAFVEDRVFEASGLNEILAAQAKEKADGQSSNP